MLSKKMEEFARSIDLARRESKDPNYQLGVRAVATAIADDHCSGKERLHFLLACGVEWK